MSDDSKGERPQYHHDAGQGETRYPPESGEQYAGDRDEKDPHSRLNTPVEDVEASAEGPTS
jgi:hypothetical protein